MVVDSVPRHHLYQVQGFKVITHSPRDAVMEWLTSLETGERVHLPTIMMLVEDLSNPENSFMTLVSNALRCRDRERVRCGLPTYWEEIAAHLEANQDAFIRRIAEAAKKEARE